MQTSDEPPGMPATGIPPTPKLAESPFVPDEVRAGRPALVTVLGVLFIVGAASELLGYVNGMAIEGTLAIVNVVDSIIFAAWLLAAGVGLLRLAPWARVSAISAVIARFVVSVPLLLLLAVPDSPYAMDPGPVPPELFLAIMLFSLLLMAAYYAVLLVFLTRPAVKAAFARER